MMMCAPTCYDQAAALYSQDGSKWLDGSLLLLPTTGFLPPEDPRITGTVRAIGRETVAGRVCDAPRSG